MDKLKKIITAIKEPGLEKLLTPPVQALSWLVFIVTIMGLRDVGISSFITSVTGIDRLGLWLDLLYWLGVLTSATVMGLGLYHRSKKIGREGIITAGLYLIFSAPFLYLLITRRMTLDFWLDELMSIVRHIQPSIRNTILSYPVPNNHVFSNLVSAVYIQLIGITDLETLLSYPIILRVPYLITGLFSILCIGYLSGRLISKRVGFMAVILLTTTIPFLNFAVQIRGYSFTILFSILLVLSILDSWENPRGGFKISLFTALMIYTIPSNVYIAGAALVYSGLSFLFIFVRAKTTVSDPEQDKAGYMLNLRLIGYLSLGLLFSLLLYSPLIPKMIGATYIESAGLFRGNVFSDAFQNSLIHFASGRWVIIIPAILGIILGLTSLSGERKDKTMRRISFLVVMIFLPYLFSFVRGDSPFERVFLGVLPSLVILVSIGLENLFLYLKGVLPKIERWGTGLLVALFLISNAFFISSYSSIEQEILNNLVEQKFDYVKYRNNRMWASHFFDHYSLLPIIETLKESPQTQALWVDKENTRYPWTVVTYLDVFDIDHQVFRTPEEISGSGGFLILSYPDESLNGIVQFHPGARCNPVLDLISIYRLYDCSFEEAE